MAVYRQRSGYGRSTSVRWWNDRRVRSILYQAGVIGGVVLLGAYLVSNTLANLESRNIATGFGFLWREAGFGVSESPIEYSPADNYARVLLVGLLNTLKVSIIGIVLATVHRHARRHRPALAQLAGRPLRDGLR